MPESFSLRAHLVHDVSTLALLALIVVPSYLLLNQYWKRLLVLVAVYGLLALVFVRLGRTMRRVMRRAPADIPPWHGASRRGPTGPQRDMQFGSAEALRNGYKDPRYLQDVLKPRLRQLLVYRLSGSLNASLEVLEATRAAHLEPAVREFLQRREATGLWAKYTRRRQRLQDVLHTLRYLETL